MLIERAAPGGRGLHLYLRGNPERRLVCALQAIAAIESVNRGTGDGKWETLRINHQLFVHLQTWNVRTWNLRTWNLRTWNLRTWNLRT
jgi:hypothetical protein